MIVYSDGYLKHNMEGHPERKERLFRIMNFLEEKDVFSEYPIKKPAPAEKEDILRVHSKGHFESMRAIGKTGMRVIGDTYYTPQTYEAALLAAGGVITGIKGDEESAFALVRPPGHHATRTASMGFCIFNNVAVGAAYASEKGYDRIAILDFDLHHGNGTQEIFYQDKVLYISLHQWPYYPGTGSKDEIGEGDGAGYTINIPLPSGVGDKSYGHALNEVVYPVLRDFSPKILLVSAGYDGHHSDPLGGLLLSSKIYYDLAKESKKLAKKIVFTLEGGYNLKALPQCMYASLRGLFDIEDETFDGGQAEDKGISNQLEAEIKSIRSEVSSYWSI
jgi:acetoin utilization deacetylase AcuC-like enzyme